MHINEEELLINSELIWTFDDVNKELIQAYPNGKSLSENLITIDGLYTWKVDVYPNGKDTNSKDKLYVSITLVNVKTGIESNVDAECNYYIINKGQNKNYTGRIERRKFTTYLTEDDASFETSLLQECNADCMISLTITQFPNIPVDLIEEQDTHVRSLSDVSSATPVYSNNEGDESDFEKVSVKLLH